MADCAVPLLRRMPAIPSRTLADPLGVSRLAIWCAWETAKMRLVIVAVLWASARSVMYSATVSAVAGSDDWPCALHQAVKCIQSERYALTVFLAFDWSMSSEARPASSARGLISVLVGRSGRMRSVGIGKSG